MNKILMRSLMRDIKRNFGRFLSLFAIVAIGVGFFAGVKAGEPAMLDSSDTYYNEQKLMDIHIIPVNGFSDSDVELISEQFDCTAVASYYTDAVVKGKKGELVARFNSYTKKVNVPIIREGRLPKKDNECIVDANSLSADIKLGDKLTVVTEGTGLKEKAYTVVGKFQSPMYLSGAQYGTTNIGDGSVDTAVYVKPSGFDMERYNQMYLYFDFLHDSESCYSDSYKTAVENIINRIEALAERQTGFIVSGTVDMREAGLGLIDSELGAQVDLLYQMRDEIESASVKLEESKEQVDALGLMIDAAKNQFDLASIEAEQGQSLVDKQYEDGVKKIYAAETALSELKLKLNAAVVERDATQKLCDEKKRQLAGITPDVPEYAVLVEEVTQLETTVSNLAASITALEAEIADSTTKLDVLKAEYDKVHQNNKTEYETLLGSQIKTLEEYNAAKLAYEKAYLEYTVAYSAYMEQASNVNIAIDSLKSAVSEVFEQIDTLWYTFDRSELPSYSEFEQNAERIGNIGKVFPAFFLLVAALVCLTSMTRMVDEQRTQIGVLKAMGYSNGAVLAYFMAYSLSATVLGCVVGCVIGFKLFQSVIMQAYAMLYEIPTVCTDFRWGLALWSSGLMVVCIAATVLFACFKEFVNLPATLIRPKAMPAGKRILLENIGFIWNRMSFIKKVTARNILRYKKRMIMTVVGIAGCTALVLTGFGLRDAITDTVSLQFNKIWKYDATVAVSDGKAAYDTLADMLSEDKLLATYQKVFSAQANDNTCDMNIIAVDDTAKLEKFIVLADRVSGEKHSVKTNGAVITEKAARQLSVSVGDKVTLKSDGTSLGEVTVTAIVENHAYNYLYMTKDYASSFLPDANDTNTYLCKLGKTSGDKFSTAALKDEHIDAVVLNAKSEETFSDIMKILDLVVLVLIISAAALAFVVLYSLANINIAERRREIATLKVLGFSRAQVNAYVFRENLVLTIVGALVGLGLGTALAMFVIVTAEIDMVMFGRTIYWYSYLISFAVTMIFSIAVNVFMNSKLDKIDMIESLKQVE